MSAVLTLLKPRYLSFRNRDPSARRGRVLKMAVLGAIGVLFWGGLFAITLRVLVYFRRIEELGDILAFKLLSMVFLTFLSLLIFSGILTSLSKLYLSRDLSLVHATPVPAYKIFASRWIESTIDSSWMVIIYTLPVFISYGVIYGGGPIYYLGVLSNLVSLSIICSAISVLLVMAAVMIVPANRIKSIFVFLTLTFFLILFFAFRMLRPERLVDPEFFETTLVYFQALRSPAPAYLPSSWSFESLRSILTGDLVGGLFHSGLSWSFAGLLVCLIIPAANAVYFNGVSKTQTAASRLMKRPISRRSVFRKLPGPIGALVSKEIRTFFRDQTQWSQLFLIGALIVIYIYNFKVLPLEKSPIKTVYLQNLLAFLNMGLATFVLSAITARFAYPAVSMEREAFWLVKSAPITLRQFLWTKFLIYLTPLLILSEVLIVATNILLNVTPFMMGLSTINVLLMVPGVIALGIGMGAAYPDFKSENPIQSVTSFGGLMFMIISAVFIIAVLVLESGPVYSIFMAQYNGIPLTTGQWIWAAGSFFAAFIMCVLFFIVPMRYGERKLAVYLT